VLRKFTLLILCTCALALAQETGAYSTPAFSGSAAASAASAIGIGATPLSPLVGVESPIISETYVLMPGDKLLVTVTGGVTYSYNTWITYEGKITVNIPQVDVVDVVTVSGLTMQAAQDTLVRVMKRYFKDVAVKLTLTGLRSGIVFLTGEVENPGAYNASPVERVSQIIARAGGLSPLGSKSRIQLVRVGRLQSIVNIEKFEANGDLMANPFVESGDVIYVPPVEALVTVKGAVFGRGEYRLRTSALTTEKERMSEGIYELLPGEKVFDVISRAGGITPWADLSNSYVNRLVFGGNGLRKKIAIDLRKVIYEQDTVNNISMMNSDVIVVPAFPTKVYVEGEVSQPASYDYLPNLRASEYIGMAGGPTNYGHMATGYIIRHGDRISLRGDPIVEAGDIVRVPRVGLKWWQDYVEIISSVAIPVATILVTLAISSGN
jgi:protein involved in polysaccharide export with SLBB domain